MVAASGPVPGTPKRMLGIEPPAPDDPESTEVAPDDVPPGDRPLWSFGEAAPLPGEEEGVESARPMATADGRRVVYTRIAGGIRDLWWLDLESGERTPAVVDPHTPQDNAAWSDDGMNLAYQSGGLVRMVLRRISD